MEHGILELTPWGIEIGPLSQMQRNQGVFNFCEMCQLVHKCQADIMAPEKVYTHPFSFGSFSDLYSKWDVFSSKEALKGISPDNYWLLYDALMKDPALRPDTHAATARRAETGFRQDRNKADYVANIDALHRWTWCWLHNNPQQIEWTSEEEFLPNKADTERILREEISKYGCDKYYCDPRYHGKPNEVALVFHHEVMDGNAGHREGYTYEIGKKICEVNWYTEETELSAQESKRIGNNVSRYIFSIYNHQYGRYQYISFDIGHGFFEFHAQDGSHKGEYHFDGTLNSPAEDDHALRCVDGNRKPPVK